MKLLLDEQVPRRLSREFPNNFEIKTAQEMGWSSDRNGVLLKLAAEEGFDALITADKNMEYQQNSDALPLTVIVLAPLFNRLSDLIPLDSFGIECARKRKVKKVLSYRRITEPYK